MMREDSSASGTTKRAPRALLAMVTKPGQRRPPPHSAAARPSSTICGPSASRSVRTGSKSFSASRPSPSMTYRPCTARPEPHEFHATGRSRRSTIERKRLSACTANMPGVGYITKITSSRVGGRPMPANSSCATSPRTKPMSISPFLSSGTFSRVPRVVLLAMRGRSPWTSVRRRGRCRRGGGGTFRAGADAKLGRLGGHAAVQHGEDGHRCERGTTGNRSMCHHSGACRGLS